MTFPSQWHKPFNQYLTYLDQGGNPSVEWLQQVGGELDSCKQYILCCPYDCTNHEMLALLNRVKAIKTDDDNKQSILLKIKNVAVSVGLLGYCNNPQSFNFRNWYGLRQMLFNMEDRDYALKFKQCLTSSMPRSLLASQRVDYSQDCLINQIQKYWQVAHREEIIIPGLCYGLSLMFIYYSFLERQEDFFVQLEGVIRQEIEVLKALPEKEVAEHPSSKVVESFATKILRLQAEGDVVEEGDHLDQKKPLETLYSVYREPWTRNLSSSMQIAAVFNFGCVEGDSRALRSVLRVLFKANNAPKALLIKNYNHAFTMFYREGRISFYDPNQLWPLDSADINNDEEINTLLAKLQRISGETYTALSLDLIIEAPIENIVQLEEETYRNIEVGCSVYENSRFIWNCSTDLHPLFLTMNSELDRAFDQVLKRLLSEPDMDDKNKEDILIQAFEGALFYGYDDKAQLLLNSKELSPFTLNSFLVSAARFNKQNLIEELIERGAQINDYAKIYTSVFIDAAIKSIIFDDPRDLQKQLKGEEDFEPYILKNTPLIEAVLLKRLDLVEFLCQRGATLDPKAGRDDPWILEVIDFSPLKTEVLSKIEAAGVDMAPWKSYIACGPEEQQEFVAPGKRKATAIEDPEEAILSAPILSAYNA
ncbi:MAG: hypothetical protein ACQEP8_05195 [Chlamydiota bacterium]